MNTGKISKLADIIRMAIRAYNYGQPDTARKLISLVASRIETIEERRELQTLVERDIVTSPAKIYFQSIIFGQGGTSVK